jgi:hypothetical protein
MHQGGAWLPSRIAPLTSRDKLPGVLIAEPSWARKAGAPRAGDGWVLASNRRRRGGRRCADAGYAVRLLFEVFCPPFGASVRLSGMPQGRPASRGLGDLVAARLLPQRPLSSGDRSVEPRLGAMTCVVVWWARQGLNL